MTMRQKIYHLWQRHDVSVSSMLLFMILAALGCTPHQSAPGERKDSDEPSTPESEKPPTKPNAIVSDARDTIAPPESTDRAPDPIPPDVPLRVVSSDNKSAYLVGVSLPASVNDAFHVRELMINPNYDALFACEQIYRDTGDTLIYLVHFKVKDDLQIVFDKLTTLSPSGTTDAPIKGNDTKTGHCLMSLYKKTTVALSGKVPFSEFQVSFNF